jgi:hypothetical protein
LIQIKDVNIKTDDGLKNYESVKICATESIEKKRKERQQKKTKKKEPKK